MSDSDPHFIELCRLLRAKKYEQPPPGYFNSFADRVITRLESEEGTEYSSWWNWLVNRYDARPVLVCAYALGVSGLLLAGLRLAQGFEAELAAAPTVGGPCLAATPISPLLLEQPYARAAYSRRASVTTFRGEEQLEPRSSLNPVSALPVQFILESR